MERNILDNRYLGAIIISPLLIFLILGGKYLFFLALILSLIGMREFYKVSENKNIRPIKIPAYLLCIVFYASLIIYNSASDIMLLCILAILIFLCIPVINISYNFVDVAVTVLGFFYVAFFFSFIPLIDRKPLGNYLVWIPFIASWSCDTLAYYFGRTFGRKKICPEVSPKKTIEGSLGGLLGSFIACGAYGYIISSKVYIMPLINFFIIGLLCGIICQFGDLVASSIKRSTGVKDYSNLIPGHGGILDRFDSILFASVTVYYYISFIIGV
jgi:phosphatidate cytidylyltransferase